MYLKSASRLVGTLGSGPQFTYMCAGLSPPVKVESKRSWCWQSLLSVENQPNTMLALDSAYDSDNLVFTGVISVGDISGIGRNWNRSDSSDSDSVELMTPFMTPIFDFH